VPHLFIGSLNGKLIVTQAQTGYEKYLGKEVTAIDGVDAKTLIERLRNVASSMDGDNQSYINTFMLKAWSYITGNNLTRHLSIVKMADGSVVRDQWIPANQVKSIKPSAGKTAYYQRRYANQEAQYRFTMKSDNIALLTLSDFTLDEVQMEAIADSLMHHKNVPNLIIDVRNNPGGHIDVCNRLVSWFIDKPTKQTNHYDKVNSNGIYQSFAHCMNIPADDKPFEDYVPREGQTGFYSPSSIADVIHPDSAVHYGGRVIILTDETSKSAATDFPALLVRNGRAITVGRETGTGYHYMTAVKFAHLALPHSHIEYTLPLVKSVADDTVSDRFPAKRGLMPDVEVPLTYDEIYAFDGDPIMEKALQILKSN
jgi:C-terminal processing protease CtpA/Prc